MIVDADERLRPACSPSAVTADPSWLPNNVDRRLPPRSVITELDRSPVSSALGLSITSEVLARLVRTLMICDIALESFVFCSKAPMMRGRAASSPLETELSDSPVFDEIRPRRSGEIE